MLSRIKKYKWNEPIWGLLLVVAFLPFKMILSSIAIGVYALLLIIKIFNKKKDFINSISFKRRTIIFTPVLYFLMVLIGLIYTDSLNDGLSRVVTQLSLVVFPLLIYLSNFKLTDINILKKVFLYSCIAFCCISIISLLYNLVDKYHYKHHYNFVQSSMYHFHFPYDSLYINFAFVALLFGSYKNYFKKIISTLFFLVILLFGVRMGLFSFFIIFLIYTTINFKKLLKPLNLLLLVCIIVSSVFLLKTSKYASDKYYDTLEKIGFDTKSKVSKIGEEYHKIDVRSVLWNSSLKLIKEKPVFGYGTGRHQEILNKQYEEANCDRCFNKNHHNQYLSTTMNYGLVGLLVLLFIMIRSFILGLRIKNLEFLLFLFLIVSSFLTESMLVRQKGVMFFSLFSSLYLVEYLLRRKTFTTD